LLGNKLHSSQIHPELKGRIDTGMKVFNEKSADYLVLSGGKSNTHIKYAECEVMKTYAVKKWYPSRKNYFRI